MRVRMLEPPLRDAVEVIQRAGVRDRDEDIVDTTGAGDAFIPAARRRDVFGRV